MFGDNHFRLFSEALEYGEIDMKKLLILFSAAALICLGGCGNGSGYSAGYEEGYHAGYEAGLAEGGYTAEDMEKAYEAGYGDGENGEPGAWTDALDKDGADGAE